MLRRATELLVVMFLGFLPCCSGVPPLSSEPGRGPSVRQIVNHINCELASIIASNPSNKVKPPLKYYGPIDPTIIEREAYDSNLRYLIPFLQEYHFVASVLMTLDTSDTAGIYPSASFIHPFTSSLSGAMGLGGQLNGSQERNVTFGYSIDLANVGDGCFLRDITEPGVGLAGSLSLGDIIADGLSGLQATENVNVYTSGGPTRPAFDAVLSKMTLGFTCVPVDPSCTEAFSDLTFDMTLSGNVNFAPSSDPQSPGSMSFSGRAKSADASYIMTLTGSTIEVGPKSRSELKFTLSGTMTRESASGSSIAKSIGYNPSVSLVGTVDDSNQFVRGLKQVSGLLTPSAETRQPTSGHAKITYEMHAPGKYQLNGTRIRDNGNTMTLSVSPSPSGAGGGAGGASASATVKSSASTSASSTQFGSLVNMMISYGVNGGPNWTLSAFKGPGGGSGPNGQLLSATRTHTATLQITFVAACNDQNNVQTITNFWESIPKCNGTQQAQAAASGQALNYLAASGRPQPP